MTESILRMIDVKKYDTKFQIDYYSNEKSFLDGKIWTAEFSCR